jgi:hypothetical protein
MRCEDCLDDLPPAHFVVVECEQVGADPDDPESFVYDDKHVCAACVGWYRDAVEVSE